MRKCLAIGTCFVVLSISLVSATSEFVKKYAVDSNDENWSYSIVEDKVSEEGGYVVAGWTYDSDDRELFISKFDESGGTLWTKVLDESNKWEMAYCLIQSIDGGYVLVGTSYDSDRDKEALISKFDSSGNEDWTTTIGGDSVDIYTSVTQLSGDSGYVAVGRSLSWTDSGGDILVSKFDKDGNHERTGTYGGNSDDWAYSVIRDKTSSADAVVVVGITESIGAGAEDVFISRINSSGSLQWTSTLGGSDPEWAFSVIQATDDSGYVVGGYTESIDDEQNMLLAKFDSDGYHDWTSIAAGDYVDQGRSVIRAGSSGYVLAGYTTSFANGTTNLADILISRFDLSGEQGNNEWNWVVDIGKQDVARSVIQVDAGYVVTGYTSASVVTSASEFFLAKFNEDSLACVDSIPTNIWEADVDSLTSSRTTSLSITARSVTIDSISAATTGTIDSTTTVCSD